jgi:hypothetical protein
MATLFKFVDRKNPMTEAFLGKFVQRTLLSPWNKALSKTDLFSKLHSIALCFLVRGLTGLDILARREDDEN